jgi:hypothetical protein
MGRAALESLLLTAAGILFGITCAATLAPYLEGMLCCLTPLDATTRAGVSVLLAVVAAGAMHGQHLRTFLTVDEPWTWDMDRLSDVVRSAVMSREVVQRAVWNGQPVEQGNLFRLFKQRGERRLDAICRLMSHQFGWELVLDVNGELQRSQVCRSQDEVLTTGERR